MKWFGVTIDDIDSITDFGPLVQSLKNLSRRPVVRLVFNKGMNPKDYLPGVKAISEVATIMGQPVDSSWMKELSYADYHQRFCEYLSSDLTKYIANWEAGNEINGSWTGNRPQDKATAASKIIRGFDRNAILTLYYTPTLTQWCNENLSIDDKRKNFDAVLLSYYEEDNNFVPINWHTAAKELSAIFPSTMIGIGEFGSTGTENAKANLIQRYYGCDVELTQWLLGGFYWYFKEDCSNPNSPLWQILNRAWQE